MRIWLITGGARSGKSRYAVDRARDRGGGDVSFIATARAVDAEMGRRIERHRQERPRGWETLEAPEDPSHALSKARHDVIVLDCLTMLVSSAVWQAEEEEGALARASDAVSDLLGVARSRDGDLLVITNEVGMSLVPPTPQGRWFRDAQGTANRRVAEEAEGTVFLVSGIPWLLAGSEP